MSLALANHLWQSTIFATTALLLAWVLRRNSAQTRFAVWLAASVKFLVPFSLLVHLGHFFDRPKIITAVAPISTAVVQFGQPFSFTDAQHLAPQASSPWPAFFAVVWLCGSAIILLRWAIQWANLRQIVHRAEPLEFVSQISAKSSPEILEPGVFGILRPVLLLPAGICQRLAPDQFSAIVSHELCHVRRRDNLSFLIHMLVESVFWFHPLVWWIGSRLLEERERACDEAVLQLGNRPEAYAEAILNVCRFCVESPLPCVAGVTGADLKRRIEEIMTQKLGRQLTAVRKVMLTCAALTAVVGPVTIGVLHSSRAGAQTRLQFDIVSVKPASPDERGPTILIQPGGGLKVVSATLKQLIDVAYSVREFQVTGGPAWAGSDRFDILAKTDQADAPRQTEVTDEQRNELERQFKERLQSLLADRFQLVARKETKEMAVYALVEAKGGSKLHPVQDPSASGNRGIRIQRGVLTGMAAPIEVMIMGLANIVGRPVIDKTGLLGKYDWKLEWTPDQGEARPGIPVEGGTNPPDVSGPSIFAAIQEQLGLKLESQKGPAPVVIIDKAEKPSPN